MKRFLLYWNKLGLTKKFSMVFSLLFSFIFLVASVSYMSFIYINKAEDNIRKSTQIERLVLQMNLGQQKARQLIGSFFLHQQQSTLQKAHESYAQPSVREISHVISISKELENLLFRERKNSIGSIKQADLNLYLASAKRFADTSIEVVELISKREAPKNGIQAQLHTQAALLAAEIHNFPILRLHYSNMVITYKDYLISRQRPVMQKALNILSDLQTIIIQNNSFTDERKNSFVIQFGSMRTLAQQLLDIDLAISSKINDFSLQEQITEPVSLKLIQFSQQEVSLAQQHIQLTQRILGFIILTTILFAFFAVLSLARLLHASVTHRVLSLAKTAREYRKGNLQVRVRVEGHDELAQLGTNINSMAERLNDLVITLEEKVEKRTTDLAIREALYRQLFDHGSNAIAVYRAVDEGQDFVFLDFNQAGEQIEHIRRDEIIGRKVTEVFPGLKETGLIDVFQEVWKSGKPVSHPVFYYNGGRVDGWRQNRVYKLPTGEIVAMYDDLTLQKRAEQEKQIMEQQLLQAQKMEAIGLLAGGVAHDLNNILTAVVNYPEILLLQLDEESPLRPPITQIRESGLRAAAVVADLLTVARGVANKMETADLNQLITTFLESSEFSQIQTDYSHIRYSTELSKNLSNIVCSTIHVIKCIMNLVINGSEAIPVTGVVTIQSKGETLNAHQAVKYGLNSASYIILSISDTGSGIAQKDLGHIFEPFYTKKVMGKKSGTGLGLSIVWNTMQDHGGGVVVHSSQKGTRFDLYFPSTDDEIIRKSQLPTLDQLQGNRETVLIIDDEPQLRDIAKTILEQLGYTIVCQKSGEDAVAYLQTHSVDILLLDMIMDPGINGREAYEKILSIHPNQKALLVSGFSENAEVDKALALGAGGFIKKPYSMHELGTAIRKILARKTNGISP
jgi:signal transduction histidine kinase/ActR/RegA family two-component response regulator